MKQQFKTNLVNGAAHVAQNRIALNRQAAQQAHPNFVASLGFDETVKMMTRQLQVVRAIASGRTGGSRLEQQLASAELTRRGESK